MRLCVRFAHGPSPGERADQWDGFAPAMRVAAAPTDLEAFSARLQVGYRFVFTK